MAYSSTVPQAIAALVAAFSHSTALGLADPPVPVFDGEPLSSGQSPDVVAVAYTGDPTESVVEGTASPDGLAGSPDQENYAVMCAAASVDAGGDVAAATARAYELHAACGQAIAADRKLGGAVLWASVGIGSLIRPQTTSGAEARVVFPCNIRAFTGR